MPLIRNAFSDDAVETTSPAGKHVLETDTIDGDHGDPQQQHQLGTPKRQKVETAEGHKVINKSSDGDVVADARGGVDSQQHAKKVNDDVTLESDSGKKIDPTELASAFALASLAALGPGSSDQSHGRDPATAKPSVESSDANRPCMDNQEEEGNRGGSSVQNMESWDETRSPKADQHPTSPEEQRSPGLGSGNLTSLLVPTQEETGEGATERCEDGAGKNKGDEDPSNDDEMSDEGGDGRNRKVTFHPNTKEISGSPESSIIGRSRLASAASRRMAKAIAASPTASQQNVHATGTDGKDSSDSMMISPRPHHPTPYGIAGIGAGPSSFIRTPPHMPRHVPLPPHYHHHHLASYREGVPPTPPHPSMYHPAASPAYHHQFPSPYHHGPPGHHLAPAFHHYSPPPHHGGPTPPHGIAAHYPWRHSPAMPGFAGGHDPAAPNGRSGPGFPRHLMQPPLMHSPRSGVASSAAAPPQPHPWVCDHCNIASFTTYEEAVRHEGICTHNPVVGRRRGGIPNSHSDMSSVVHSLLSMSRSMSDIKTGIATDSSDTGKNNHETWYSGSMKLSLEDSDREWLSEVNCYIRDHCVEVFSATVEDVSASAKRGHIALHQVGLRCVYCKHRNCEGDKEAVDGDDEEGVGEAENTAVSYPDTVSSICEYVERWQRVHLPKCSHVPVDVKAQLASLASTTEWTPSTRQYWINAARALGLVDTVHGIRFSQDPKSIRDEVRKIARLPSGEEPEPRLAHGGGVHRLEHLHAAVMAGESSSHRPPLSPQKSRTTSQQSAEDLHSQSLLQQASLLPGGYIVHPEDIEMIPPYVYFLMRQVEPCLFTEADRFVARSKGPIGYPGFQCRHCNGHAGLGKYFPISSKSLSTNSTSQNIHAHLLKCRKCPCPVKDELVQLKIEKSRQPRLEPGWRKVFFDKVWARLHRGEDGGFRESDGVAPASATSTANVLPSINEASVQSSEIRQGQV